MKANRTSPTNRQRGGTRPTYRNVSRDQPAQRFCAPHAIIILVSLVIIIAGLYYLVYNDTSHEPGRHAIEDTAISTRSTQPVLSQTKDAAPSKNTPVLNQYPTTSSATAVPPSTSAAQTTALSGPWQDSMGHGHADANGDTAEKIVTGSFEIQTEMPDLPRITCDWMIPVTRLGRPLTPAADIVCIFPYPTEKQAITITGKALSSTYRFSCLSLRMPGMGPDGGINPTDHSRFYYYPESGSGKAWTTAITQLRTIAGLPSRPVYVTGRSGGGSAAILFADAHPDMVAGVVNEAGRVFSDKANYRGPILLLYGHHDYVAKQCREYYDSRLAAGASITYFTFPANWSSRGRSPIWQHGISGSAAVMQWQWLSAIADMNSSGTNTSMTQWPETIDSKPLPSIQCRISALKITPPATTYSYGGLSVTIAQPAINGQRKGVIYRFTSPENATQEEAELDSEFFSDNGYFAVTITGYSQSHRADLNNAIIRSGINISGLQSVSCFDFEANNWRECVEETRGITALIAMRLYRGRLTNDLHEYAVSQKCPLMISDAKQRLDRLDPKLQKSSGSSIITTPISMDDRDISRQEWLRGIVAAADKTLKKKSP